jgi:E3 ubiquitin-protein ligase RHA2
MASGHDAFEVVKEERMKQRLEEINNAIKSQHFYDWLASQKDLNPKSLLTTDPLW